MSKRPESLELDILLKKIIPSLSSPIKFQQNDQIAYKNLIKLLCIYEDIDRIFDRENIDKNLTSLHFKSLIDRMSDQIEKMSPTTKKKIKNNNSIMNDIKFVNSTIQLYLLNVTFEEFHKFFAEFFQYFERDLSLRISESNFKKLLEFMKEIMGKEKFQNSIFLILNPNKFLKKIKSAEECLLNYLFNENPESKVDDEIDFLKALPFIISFFLEFMKNEIKRRKLQLIKLKGIDENKSIKEAFIDKNKINPFSLLYRVEKSGISLEEIKNNTKCITFRIAEKILTTFQTQFKKILNFDQVELILKDLAKIMNVDPITKIEKKKIKLKKLIDILAIKISIHCSCSKLLVKNGNLRLYIEEAILWNCAGNSEKFNDEYITQKFIKNFKKSNLKSNKKNILYVLENLTKKLIPNITRDEFQIILKNFEIESLLDDENDIKIISKYIYSMFIFHIDQKLRNYIIKCYELFKKERNEVNLRSNEIKLFNDRSNNLKLAISLPHIIYEEKNSIYDESSPKIISKKIEKDLSVNNYQDNPNIIRSFQIMEQFFEKFKEKKLLQKIEKDTIKSRLKMNSVPNLSKFFHESPNSNRNKIYANKEIVSFSNLKLHDQDSSSLEKINFDSYMNTNYSFKDIKDIEGNDIKSNLVIDENINVEISNQNENFIVKEMIQKKLIKRKKEKEQKYASSKNNNLNIVCGDRTICRCITF